MKYFFVGMRSVLAVVLGGLLAGPAARAQAPAWQSAVAAITTPASSSPCRITSTAADAGGNVYLTGYFSGTATFSGTALTSRGGTDVFVGKWNVAAARFVWVQQAGGTGDDQAVAVASSGTNVYIAGFFTDAAATFGAIALPNAGNLDGFVAKLTDTGTTSSFGWAQRIGGTGTDKAEGMTVSGSNVYLVGSFGGTASIGSYSLSSAGSADIFVARLGDQGPTASVDWAQRAGGTDYDYADAVAVNGSSVYVSGSFISASIVFGSSTVVNTNQNVDLFVAKLTDAGSSGSFGWAKSAGGIGTDNMRAIIVNGPNVYIAGSFSNTATFGPLTVATAGNYDLFVAKLTDAGPTGSFTWVRRAGGPDDDYAVSLAARGASVYVAGAFKSTADFGPGTLTSPGNYDAFVARILDAGPSSSFAWVQQAGGTDIDAASAVVLAGTSVLITGYVTPAASFGALALAGPAGSRAHFVASLTDATLTATASTQSTLPFTLAPNPARIATTVQLPALPGAATACFTLCDALSRAVRTATVALPPAGLRHELSLAGLAPGLYALQVRAGEATATRRLVVE